MNTMNRYIVRKLSKLISKDPVTSILAQTVVYMIDDVSRNVSIISEYRNVLPDNFEIELKDTADTQDVVNKIVQNVSSIGFKRDDLDTCPICGSKVYNVMNHTVCVNIDCITDEKLQSVIQAKLEILLPAVPPKFLSRLIYFASMDDIPLSVSSVIAFASELIKHDIHEETKDDLRLVIISAREISLANIITAICGIPYSDDLSNIINFYNTRLIDMITDIKAYCEDLKTKVIDKSTVILISQIVDVNMPFIAHVVA